MNRFLLTVFISLTTVVSAISQTRICNFDFENGIPDTLILKDYDGQIPMNGLNFPQNTAWTIWDDPYDETNKIVCSCSYYQDEAQAAEDWLIIPNVALPEDSAVCQLFWRSRSAYNTYKDGYRVLITTEDIDGHKEINELNWKSLLYVNRTNNPAQWNAWQCDISKYAGKKVSIAFVNFTMGGWMLYLDDITIGDKDCVATKVMLTNDKYVADGTGEIKAKLKVGIMNEIQSFTAQIVADKDTIKQLYTGLKFTPNKVYELALEKSLSGIAPQQKKYKIELINDKKQCFASDSSSFTYLLNLTSGKNVVAENYINYNDGYSIRAIEGYKLLKEKHWFIGLQLHTADTLKDSLDVYEEFLQDKYGMNDVCDLLIDRKTSGDVYNDIIDLAYSRKEELALVESYIEGFSNDSILEIETKTIFALDSEELKCNYMFILTEDSVWNNLLNIYAGGDLGEFNKYESLDSTVSISFNDVVRKTYSADTLRFENTVAGDTINGNFKLALPTNIENHRMLRMTMIVTDSSNGEILNAARCSLEYKGEKDPTTSVIENICEENLAVTDECVIYNAGATAEVSVYTPCGKLSSFACGEGTITAALPREKGLYIIVVRENELTLTKKLLRK